MGPLIAVLLVLAVIFLVVLILRDGKEKSAEAKREAETVISKAKGE